MIVSRLIRAGHSWSEIQNYTAAQIRLFLDCAVKLDKEERGNGIVDVAIASQGSQKNINEACKKLSS